MMGIFIWGCIPQQVNITIEGSFSNCQKVLGGNSTDELCQYNSSMVRWGTPTTQSLLSGLEFVASPTTTLGVNNNDQASIGSLIHHNWPIKGNIPNYVDFDLYLKIYGAGPTQNTTIPYTLEIDETSNQVTDVDGVCPYANNSDWFGLFTNESLCCPYYTPNDPCSDRIRFVTPFNRNATFYVNETEYTLRIEGFINIPILNETIVDTFITQERFTTSGVVFASLVAVCSENTTCDDNNACTVDSCEDGFCDYNITALNRGNCTYKPNKYHVIISQRNNNQECYEDYCWYGKCVREYYNCSGASSSESTSSDGAGDGNGGGDTDLTPLYGALAATAYLCMLLSPLLCLPLLCIFALLFGKVVTLPTSVGVASGYDPSNPLTSNPLYNPLEKTATNPLFDG